MSIGFTFTGKVKNPETLIQAAKKLAEERSYGLSGWDPMKESALNTICNYDPDIIPLPDSEPGTAWSRGEDGVFRPELYEDD